MSYYLYQYSRKASPGHGGVERVVDRVSMFFLQKGVNSTNIYIDSGDKNTQNPYDNIHIFSFRFFYNCFAGLYKSTSHVIHIFHFPSVVLLFVSLIVSLFSRKSSVYFYFHAFASSPSFVKGLLLQFYQFLFFSLSRILRVPFITTSPELATYLLRYLATDHPIYVLPCVIDEHMALSVSFTSDNVNDLKNSIPTYNKSDNFNIIFIGRLDTYKRLDWLLEIMPKLQKAHLYVVGTGPKMRKYKSLVQLLSLKTRVHFLGRLNDFDKFKCLKYMDLLILPSSSSSEAFGIVQLEAMFFGVVPIATHLSHSAVSWVGGISEFLGMPPITKSTLPDVLQLFSSDRELLNVCKKYSKERYANLFSNSCWVKTFDAILLSEGITL